MSGFKQDQLSSLEGLSITPGQSQASYSPNPAMAASKAREDSARNGKSDDITVNYNIGSSNTLSGASPILSKLVDIETAINNLNSSNVENAIKLNNAMVSSAKSSKMTNEPKTISSRFKNLIDPLVNAVKDPIENAISRIQFDTTVNFAANRGDEGNINEIKKSLTTAEFQTLKMFSSQARASMSEVLAFRRNSKQILAGSVTADEQKVKLMAALVDINRYQGQELVSIRAAVQKSAGGDGPDGNQFDQFGEMQANLASKLAFRGIKLLLNPIETFYNKPKEFFNKLKLNNTNELSPIELLKKAGLHVSDQNKAFTFMGNVYPDIAQESNTILNKQLHVQKSMFDVMSDIKVLLGGQKDSLKPSNIQSQKYDAITGEFVNEDEFNARRANREILIKEAQEDNKTFLQKVMTTKAGRANELSGASAALDNSTKEGYDSAQSDIAYKKKRKQEANIVSNTIKIADAFGLQPNEKIAAAKSIFDGYKNQAITAARDKAIEIGKELASNKFNNASISNLASKAGSVIVESGQNFKVHPDNSRTSPSNISQQPQNNTTRQSTSNRVSNISSSAINAASSIFQNRASNDEVAIKVLKVVGGKDIHVGETNSADSNTGTSANVNSVLSSLQSVVSSVVSTSDSISKTRSSIDSGIDSIKKAKSRIENKITDATDSNKNVEDRVKSGAEAVDIALKASNGIIKSANTIIGNAKKSFVEVQKTGTLLKNGVDTLVSGHETAENVVSSIENAASTAYEQGKTFTDSIRNKFRKKRTSNTESPYDSIFPEASVSMFDLAKQKANAAKDAVTGAMSNALHRNEMYGPPETSPQYHQYLAVRNHKHQLKLI